jgi:hypothetical protein
MGQSYDTTPGFRDWLTIPLADSVNSSVIRQGLRSLSVPHCEKCPSVQKFNPNSTATTYLHRTARIPAWNGIDNSKRARGAQLPDR